MIQKAHRARTYSLMGVLACLWALVPAQESFASTSLVELHSAYNFTAGVSTAGVSTVRNNASNNNGVGLILIGTNSYGSFQFNSTVSYGSTQLNSNVFNTVVTGVTGTLMVNSSFTSGTVNWVNGSSFSGWLLPPEVQDPTLTFFSQQAPDSSGHFIVKQGNRITVQMAGSDPSRYVSRVGISHYDVTGPLAIGSLNIAVANTVSQAMCSYVLDTSTWKEKLTAPVTQSLTFTATNFSGRTSAPRTLTFTVVPNTAPQIVVAVEPAIDIFSTDDTPYVLANLSGSTPFTIDLSGTTDAELDPLYFNVEDPSYNAKSTSDPKVFRIQGYDGVTTYTAKATEAPSLVDATLIAGVTSSLDVKVGVIQVRDAIDKLGQKMTQSCPDFHLRTAFALQVKELLKTLDIAGAVNSKGWSKTMLATTQLRLKNMRKLAAAACKASPTLKPQTAAFDDALAQIAEKLADPSLRGG